MAEPRRFPAPWIVEESEDHCFRVKDANGMMICVVLHREDLYARGYQYSNSSLTRDEARRIAKGISRLPELLIQLPGFRPRGGHSRWRADRPYHIAIADMYLRERWSEMNALCQLNRIPFDRTGERIERGSVWCVFEFALQLHAIQFWDRFEGRWMLGEDFHYPEKPKDLPPLKELKGWPQFDPKKARG